jgi:hypothetical protein
MQSHMLMGMYAPSDALTISVNVPLLRKQMTHVMQDGMLMSERSSGIGDVTVTALYGLYSVDGYRHRFIVNAAISVPTGSINPAGVRDNVPIGSPEPLDYSMRLGSGTWEILPGLTYLGHTNDWAFGAEIIPRVRLGTNSRSYRLGNELRAGAWGSRRLTDWLSIRARIDSTRVGNIVGADPDLDAMMAPTQDPLAQGSRVVDAGIGLDFYVPRGDLKGQRLALEVGRPVYQSFDGPQLQSRWQLRVGWQWVFYGPAPKGGR